MSEVRVTLVPMSDLPPMRDLADRLFAAEQDADAYHHDLCAGRPDAPCSCGTPRLLRDLAAMVERLGLAKSHRPGRLPRDASR